MKYSRIHNCDLERKGRNSTVSAKVLYFWVSVKPTGRPDTGTRENAAALQVGLGSPPTTQPTQTHACVPTLKAQNGGEANVRQETENITEHVLDSWGPHRGDKRTGLPSTTIRSQGQRTFFRRRERKTRVLLPDCAPQHLTDSCMMGQITPKYMTVQIQAGSFALP